MNWAVLRLLMPIAYSLSPLKHPPPNHIIIHLNTSSSELSKRKRNDTNEDNYGIFKVKYKGQTVRLLFGIV